MCVTWKVVVCTKKQGSHKGRCGRLHPQKFVVCFFNVKQTDRGTKFRRSHHTVRKTTLYDMDVDPTCKYAAVGCQDRCIRCVYMCVCV